MANFQITSPKSGSFPSSWLGLTKTWNAERNLALLGAVQTAGVDPHDLKKVERVWRRQGRQAATRLRELRRRVTKLRARLAPLNEEIRNLEAFQATLGQPYD